MTIEAGGLVAPIGPARPGAVTSPDAGRDDAGRAARVIAEVLR